MSGKDWVSRQDPSPPAELADAMRTAVGEGEEEPTADDLLESAERLLDKVLRTDCETRASALDLLTVDALITRALEIGPRDGKLFDDLAEQAMRRIATRVQG
jgi:hypothetical protein